MDSAAKQSTRRLASLGGGRLEVGSKRQFDSLTETRRPRSRCRLNFMADFEPAPSRIHNQTEVSNRQTTLQIISWEAEISRLPLNLLCTQLSSHVEFRPSLNV